jgi:hypothetical protein
MTLDKMEEPKLHWSSIREVIGFLSVGALSSWYFCDWTWFARSGAFCIFWGVIEEGRMALNIPSAEEQATRSKQDQRDALRTVIILVAISTLVWGFGDLINYTNFCR